MEYDIEGALEAFLDSYNWTKRGFDKGPQQQQNWIKSRNCFEPTKQKRRCVKYE